MATRTRLDAELVRRGLARSREQAQQLVSAGRVTVSGRAASKSTTAVGKDDPVIVAQLDDAPTYVSRGAHKLLGGLAAFNVTVAGRRALDAGASTGGFTDVLLRHGVGHVVAVDVGYGQLAWSLQTDERVTVLDRTNIRHLTELAGGPVDLVVADLSFIPLGLVLPALKGLATETADFVLLVKPQFEVGRERLPHGGVVRDPLARRDSIVNVARQAAGLALGVNGVTASPLPGPAGNVEYLIWLRRGEHTVDVESAAESAVREGPQ